MILKALREKSNKDYINIILEKRVSQIDGSKLNSVAVLLNMDEFGDAELFRTYFKELGLLSPRNKVVYFVNDKQDIQAQWETYFSKKDFGWKGKIKNLDLDQFVNETYDVLIAYYNADVFEMHQIVAMSKANFKVGIHNHDERLFDLIVSVETSRFEVFKQEFRKYLKILKKI